MVARAVVIVQLFALPLLGGLPELAFAQSAEEEREWMYQQYLQLPNFVRGGQVETRWLSDGERFWFVEHGVEERPVYLVDPPARTTDGSTLL
jgi:hypothetical protein